MTDNKECARCGRWGDAHNIHIHHKDGNHSNNAPENKIYLCTPCHSLWHKGRWTYNDCDLMDSNINVTENPFNAYPVKSIFLGKQGVFMMNTDTQVIRVPVKTSEDFLLYLNPDGSLLYIPAACTDIPPAAYCKNGRLPKYYTMHFDENSGEVRYVPVTIPLYPKPVTGVPERDIDYVF
jgi:hypothetical protein